MTETESRERRHQTTLKIRAPRSAVWKALTDARELTRWFAPDAEIDPEVGGRVVWRWNEGEIAWPQVIEELEEETLLRTRYDSSVADGAGGKVPLYVEFRLEGKGGETTLRLVHSGFGPEADFDTEYDGISRGWPVELRSLRHYVENHLGVEREVVARIVDVGDLDLQEAWERLAGPEGLACADAIRGKSEGDAYAFTTSTGERFEGTVLTTHPRELSAVATSHGKAWLRCSTENCGGTHQAWMWLATYGLAPERRAAVQRTFDEVARKAFGAQVAGGRA